jgi:large subunit ribosomal protein L8e
LAQAVYCGKKSTLSIGNIKPVGEMPEGTIICNVEEVRFEALCYAG